jgi:glycosyltransferase involved in cell wall biosynthesis
LDFAAFFSTWPETYCYTLSEALENGLYPFAFDIGAVGERVKNLGIGQLASCDMDIRSLVEQLHDFGMTCRTHTKQMQIGDIYAYPFLKNYYDFNLS